MRTPLVFGLMLVLGTLALVPGAQAANCTSPDVPCCFAEETNAGERGACARCLVIVAVAGGYWDPVTNECFIK